MQTQILSRTKSFPAKALHAFSLVELLVVIAVIGIIAAIAIPSISGITGSANSAKTLRNAQSVASVYSAAMAAGATTTATTVPTAVGEVTTSPGLTGGGTLTNAVFYVPLSAAEVTLVNACTNLTYDTVNKQLVYTP